MGSNTTKNVGISQWIIRSTFANLLGQIVILLLAGRTRICREFSGNTMVRRVTRIYEETLHARDIAEYAYEH